MKRAVLLVGLIGLLGCAATVWSGKQSWTLHAGMTKQQAQQLFGSPQQIATQDVDGTIVEMWKYMDRTLVFQNGLLHAWMGTGTSDSDQRL